MSRMAVVAALVVAGILVVGCGDTVIDNTKAEDAIQRNLESSLHRKVSSVSCPSDQKVDPGATFTCTIDFSGGKQAVATLKIINKDADVSLVGLKATK
jgi:threonine dehydrogenase-like Zn-dependent dehydrogenase